MRTQDGVQRVEIIDLFIQPPGHILRRQNRRHAVLKLSDQRIGIRHDEGAGAERLASRIPPNFVQSGHTKHAAVFQNHPDGVFFLAFLPPIIEAIARDDATLRADDSAVRRILVDVTQIRVNRVFSPIRNKPPAELVEHPLPLLLKHDRRRLRRANVETVLVIAHDPPDLKMLLNFGQLGRDGKPLTHEISSSFDRL
ncbi:hypothetical protein D3C74_332390 [compost metagenome]